MEPERDLLGMPWQRAPIYEVIERLRVVIMQARHDGYDFIGGGVYHYYGPFGALGGWFFEGRFLRVRGGGAGCIAGLSVCIRA